MFVELHLDLVPGSQYPGTLFINLKNVSSAFVAEDGKLMSVTLTGHTQPLKITGENVTRMQYAMRQHLQATENRRPAAF